MTTRARVFHHVAGVAPNVLHTLFHLIFPAPLPFREALFLFLFFFNLFTAAQAEKNSLKFHHLLVPLSNGETSSQTPV